MNNQPVQRTQADGKQEAFSERAVIDCSTLPDKTRQEFKAETDINTVLRRFTIGDLHARTPRYGDFDFTTDLQRSLATITAAKRAFAALPQELQDKYGSWEVSLTAAATGDLEIDLQDVAKARAAAKRQADLTATLEREDELSRARSDRDLEREISERKKNPKPSSKKDTDS